MRLRMHRSISCKTFCRVKPTGHLKRLKNSNWLETSQPLNTWLAENFDAINAAIRESPIWQTELTTDEEETGAQH